MEGVKGVAAKFKRGKDDAANYAKKLANKAKEIARNVKSGVSKMNNSRRSALISTNRPGGSSYLSLHPTSIIKKGGKKNRRRKRKTRRRKRKTKRRTKHRRRTSKRRKRRR